LDKLMLHFTRERVVQLEVDTVIGLMEGTTSVRAKRDLVKVFAVDEQGKYLDEVEALRLIGRLKLHELNAAYEQVLRGAEEAAVSPLNGSK
jgi:hypothetical protein